MANAEQHPRARLPIFASHGYSPAIPGKLNIFTTRNRIALGLKIIANGMQMIPILQTMCEAEAKLGAYIDAC